MKIVKFKNGTYGLRKGIFFFSFRDLEGRYWWHRNSVYLSTYQGTLEEVKRLIDNEIDMGTPITQQEKNQ